MKYLYSLIIVFSILVNPINTFAEEVVLAGGCFWCLGGFATHYSNNSNTKKIL